MTGFGNHWIRRLDWKRTGISKPYCGLEKTCYQINSVQPRSVGQSDVRANVDRSSRGHSVKLPKLIIDKFDGEISAWEELWNQYDLRKRKDKLFLSENKMNKGTTGKHRGPWDTRHCIKGIRTDMEARKWWLCSTSIAQCSEVKGEYMPPALHILYASLTDSEVCIICASELCETNLRLIYFYKAFFVLAEGYRSLWSHLPWSYPWILSTKHRYRELLIQHCHKKFLHSGTQNTLQSCQRQVRHLDFKGQTVCQSYSIVGRWFICMKFKA